VALPRFGEGPFAIGAGPEADNGARDILEIATRTAVGALDAPSARLVATRGRKR